MSSGIIFWSRAKIAERKAKSEKRRANSEQRPAANRIYSSSEEDQVSSVQLQPGKAIQSPRAGVLSAPGRQAYVYSLVLIILTIALYYPVKNHPFVNYDDDVYVTDNIQVQSGLSWDTVNWAFVTYDAANWHPLTWLSHALDCQLYDLNPGGHHQTSMLLHVLNALLLFWVLQRATGFAGRSFMVAALFAVHPINVESVVWIAERKTVLSMVFFLLALGAYRWYAGKPGAGRYAVVAILFVLGSDGQAPDHYVSLCPSAVGLLAAAANVVRLRCNGSRQ